MDPWTEPVWRTEADAWISEQLERLGLRLAGEMDQVHIRPWATVMRVPTTDGDVYFKANAPSFRFEAALVERLAARRPDCVPPLLGVDRERGWMLMTDAGEKLRELIATERELTRWLEVLPLYAGLQIDLADEADELIALGVPDLRLSTLPARASLLLDELVEPTDERRRLAEAMPLVREMCDELLAFDLPETIQHDDLHDGQVFVRDGRYLLLDWGDACISHPFFTTAVTLDGVIAWGVDDIEGSTDTSPFRDAYLAPFVRLGSEADLIAACTLARRLGWLCRAVNGHFAGSEQDSTGVRLRMFLDGRP